MLVRHLPPDSALAREVHGESADWTATDYLLATAVDQLTGANWMFATVHQDEDAEPLEYPKPLPRPSGYRGDDDAGPAARRTGDVPAVAGPGPGPGPGPEEFSLFFA